MKRPTPSNPRRFSSKPRKFEPLERREMLAADSAAEADALSTVDDSVSSQVTAAAQFTTDETKVAELSRRSVGVPVPSTPEETRSFDGSGNNLENPEFGATGVTLVRVAGADYADGVSALAGEDRPSAREISNAIAAQDPEAGGNGRQLSAFIYVWGQFLDHDIDLTESENLEAESIDVPTNDPFFDPDGTGEQSISFFRSLFDPSTGTGPDNPREQINQITAFIDGSQVYGSDQATADSLRTFEGGKLRTSEGDLPPTDEDGSFLAGDIRANENIELTSMHTLFIREHNWWADQIAAEDPSLTDEEIYQQARAIVIAEIQVITFEEFLPALLGHGTIAEYAGYDPTVNPGIANEFSTAAFRLGHSFLNDDVEFFGDDGRAVFEEVTLAEAFFNPGLLQETGIDSILKYAASSQSQELDNTIVDSVRNFLFGEPGQGGLDLASLNIQRGRDHGLADYNSVREAYGLERVNSFADITSDVELQQTLADLYNTVDDIDLWVGALAEDHVAGSSVGDLIQTIVVGQFTRLRDGDRFWYENTFSDRDVRLLERTSLSEIIQRNTTVTNLQENVFFMSATVSGRVLADGESSAARGRRGGGLSGVTVELLNDEGAVVGTTVTNRQGFYRFDDFRETGDYQVRVLRPTASGTVIQSADILVSRGEVVIDDLDFTSEEAGGREERRNRRQEREARNVALEGSLQAINAEANVDELAVALSTSRRQQRNAR